MKTIHFIKSVVLGGLLLPILCCSCGEDRWSEYSEQTKTDRWIDSVMRVNYLWEEELPPSRNLNYFSPPFTFFKSLLSKQDRFSFIDSLNNVGSTRAIDQLEYSYGIQFQTVRMVINEQGLDGLLVLYVAKGSPAERAGLVRGDIVLQIGEEKVSNKNYLLLNGGPATSLQIGRLNTTLQEYEIVKEPVQLEAACAITDNPVYLTKVFEVNNKRVGYLVYNHFTNGLSDNSSEYDNDLRTAFKQFAAANVNEFVLDLRYNNGGYLTCAELLCAMLAPASALGQPLARMDFNRHFKPLEMEFNSNLIATGANLNLSTLYVLTGPLTASASEMVINCLKPYMKVVVIGQQTIGKNVASNQFLNRELMITMNPIVGRIYNAQGESNYEAGFTPDYTVVETNDMIHFLPLGDNRETVLNTALNLIAGKEQQPETENPQTRTLSTGYQSLQERSAQGLILNIKP